MRSLFGWQSRSSNAPGERRRRRSPTRASAGIEPLEQRRLLAADSGREVVLIDSALLASIPQEELAGSLVVSVDAGRDAVAQISTALAGLSNVDVVRVISHGSDGSLWFGDQRIDAATLAARADEVAGWRRSLAADGDILLYGCSVASTDLGRDFVRELAGLTEADVAASSNVTGAGGDETLEFNAGDVTAALRASAASYLQAGMSLEAYTINQQITSWTNNMNGTATIRMSFDLRGQFYYAGGHLSNFGWVYMYVNGQEVAELYEVVGNGKAIAATVPLRLGNNEISVSARRGFPTTWQEPDPIDLPIEAPYYLGMPSTLTVPVGQWQNQMYVVSNAFGTPTIRYSATNLPRGVTIDSRGVILGIPETGTAGVYNVVLQATNGFATATHNMTVTVTNQAPSFTSTTPAVLSGAAEDTDFTITHAALAAALDESDPNNDPLSFRIESLLGGTLTKNGSPVAAGSTLLGPGESLVWTPPPTVNGTLDAFTVKVSDGALFSATAKTVRVSIGAVNDRPTFSQFSGPVASGNEDTVIPISLAALLGSGDEADIDGSVTAFVVKSVTTGTLRIGTSDASATPWNATTNAAVTSSLNAYWTPAPNANGAQSAFTAVARDDGGLESLTPVQAVVSVVAVNDAPTLTSVAIISGATASDPFEITYATLANAANAADVDADPTAFRIEAISTGSLDKWSGSAWTAVTAGTTLIAAGEKLRWTPAAGTSGLRNAFTVRAWDGQAASATAIQVRVDGDVWRVRPWTDAASSGISTLSNYTHAYSFGAAGSFAVNGLTFTGLSGTNPAVTGRLSTTGFGGVVTNDANSLADASRSLANDAVSTSASSASVTLRGLAPGGRYVLSLYTVGRDTTARLATLSSAMGQLTVDQNALGTDNGVRIDYQYLADASGSVTISLAVPSAAFSLYGLANREVAPAIGLYAPSALTYDAAPKPFQAYASAANPLPFISAGTLHSVVLRSDGTVSAFGTNQDGQTNVPAGLANVVAVSAGGYHTMALTSAGTVVAWGNNYASQSTVPAGLSNVVAIAAGGSHSLALRNDGTVVAWGSNSGGQTNVPAGLTGVVAIAAGSTHSLALKGDGTVVAWGYGFYNYATPPAGLTDVVAISAGEWHSLALKSDGTVVAWGNNGSFQCNVPAGLKGVVAVSAGTGHSIALKADGTVVAWGDRDNYGSTVIPAGLSGVVAIDAGSEHSIALKSDGTVVTFGWTRFGQQYIPNSTGTLVQVSAGVNHTLALRIDGSVVAWGANYQGQLNVPAGLTGVAAVQAGNNFSVALKGDGTVVAWGYNQSGQRNVPPGLADVVKISATGDHVLALKRDGTVVAWGNNQYGQTNVPSGLTDVVDIAAGGDRSLALRRDGTVVGWGNYGNQWLPAGLAGIKAISCGDLFALLLKNDGTVLAYGYNNHGVATVPAGLTGVVAIDAGYQHALALKADGTVVGWGNAAWGVTTPPDSTRGVGVVAVIAGSSTSYALKSDGTVIGWGLDAGDNQPPAVGLAGRMTPILNSYTYSYQGRGSTAYAASATAPTNAGDYTVTATATGSGNTVSVSRDFTIAKVTPAPFYYTRTNTITYGASLTSQQVDTLPAWWWNQGTFTQIPGTTTFFPTIGTVLPAGTHTLQLTFVPTDSVNFNPAVATSTITVQKATVAAGSITLTPPASLTYTGEAKAYTASATGVAGFTYSYSGRAGTVYGPSSVAPTYAGDYTVTATVADPNSQGSKSLDFTVAKVVPVITAVPTATALTFGQTLASSTLSGGTASVPGSFAFRDSTLQVNAAGSIPQDFVFTPTDTVNYATVAGTVFVNVSALAIAAGAFTFSAPGSLVYSGTPKTHSATAAGPSGTLYGMSYSYAGIGGTTYGPSTTAPTNAGSYAVTATLTGSNFTGSATRTFTITQAVPTVTWATPANIAYGTALSATQLSATASVAGSFTYTPASGTVLAAGARTLEAVFTPTDTVNYASVTTTRPLQVTTTSLPISLVPPPLVYDGTAKGYVVSQMAYLSSGWDHSVALNTNGTVTAFGSNSDGQTSVPAGLSGVVQVSAGAYHSVAVKSNGTLVTWGSNSWSQGSGAVLNLPYTGPGWTAITQRDVITNATAAAAGGVLTVVLRTDGTVTVLGDSYETSAVNVPAGLSGVTAVAAGWEHAVALKADGTVVAWGENVHGQTNVPAGLSGVVAIAAWGNHTLALKSDGTVVAWGNNSARQTTVPAGLSGIVAITAAFSSSFALKADGSVIGWGSMSPVSAFRQVAAPGSGVVAFSSDANGNLRLLKSDGTVTTVDGTSLATGIGFPAHSVSYVGRAGTIYAASATPPTNAGSYAVTVTSTDPNYSASRTVDFTIAKATPTITTLPQAAIITEGQDLSAAILDGGVGSVPGTFAFTSPGFVPSAGSTTQEITFTPTDSVNYASVTATVTVRSQGASAAVPTILTPPTAAAITFGQRLQVSTLSGGVASVPGTFVYSSRLTVPNPGTARQSVTFVPDDIASYAAVTILVPLTVYDGVASPLNVSLVPPASLTYDGSPKAFRVARGSLVSSGNYGHFLVVKSDATVGAFGDNSAGQLNVPAGLTGVVAVAAGEGSAMALKADGTVVEWGSLWMGAAPAGLSGVVAIARGTSHALALKADGTVVAWGYNGSGQCNVPAGLTGVVAIAGSVSSSFALKSDGTIVAWGANAYGQLDIPAGLSGVVALSTSSYGPIAALKSDGTVVCWGKNDKGQATVPAGLSGVVAVAAGENHTVALKSDGTVVAWGDGTSFTPTGWNGNLVPWNLANVVAIDASSDATYAIRADGSVVWWGQRSSYGAARVNGEIYRTPSGAGVSVPEITPLLAADSAGFAFSTTYAGRESTTYSATATPPTEPGDYSVTVTGTDPDFAATKTLAFTIAKATPTITAAPTAAGITFGESLASAALSGGGASVAGSFAFAAPGTIPNAGTASQTVVFTPADAVRYLPVALNVSVAVAQATPTLVTLPTAATIAYGQTLASAVLGSGLASVPGVFAFTAPGTAPTAGTAARSVTFTPTDTVNYAPITASVDVLVIRATPSVSVSPTSTSIRAGQSLANAILSGGTASVPGTFAFADTSLAPSSGTASQDVVFTPTDSANYAPVTLGVAVRVRSFDPGDVADIAGEAGGVANAAAGFDAVGNVLDGQSNYDGTAITVTAVTGPGGAGTVGSALAGTYGSLTLRSDGSYVYVVNDTNPTVQALPLGATLQDDFSYTVASATDSATAALRVTVYGGNDAPTFSALGGSPLKTVNEDTEVSITFAELRAAGNETDLDGMVVAFVVTSLAGGTLRIGADAVSALPWDADSNSRIDATQNAYWTPAADLSGTLPAFAIVARDDGGSDSPTPVTVQIAVTPVNDAPALTPVEITFIDTIAADSFAPVSGTFAASDVDVDSLTFGVTGVTPAGDVVTQTGSYGTLVVNRLTGAYAFTPNATGINAATTAVSETFPIVVSDGAATTAALLTISIAATDDRPTLSAVESHATPGTEDTATEVSFADLLAAGNEADVDGTVTAFVVTEVKSGRLVIGSSAATGTEWNATTNHLITSTLKAFWTPDTNAFGLLDAFSVIARDDGGNESTTPFVYRVSVASANDAPSLTSFPLVVGTTAEDTQAELTFAALAAVGDEADIDGTVTAFVVTAVASGTLRIGATAATASPWDSATNAVVTTGLQAYWTPAANASGTLTAFSVVARDDGGLDSPIAVPVSVLVSAVNDPPVNTVPAAQTVNEDTDLVFSAASGNAISVADLDLGSLPAEVTLTATNGVLTLGSTTGLTFTTGDGTADATLVFTGARADVNAALAGLTYRPTSNVYGDALLTVTTSDQGGSGSGGPLADTDTVAITVLSVNDTPTDITLTGSAVAENAASGTTVGTLATTDVDTGDTFTYTLVAGTGDTDNAAFAVDGSTLKTTAAFDFEARSSYTVRVRSADANGLFTEKAFTISVTNVNEADRKSVV